MKNIEKKLVAFCKSKKQIRYLDAGERIFIEGDNCLIILFDGACDLFFLESIDEKIPKHIDNFLQFSSKDFFGPVSYLHKIRGFYSILAPKNTGKELHLMARAEGSAAIGMIQQREFETLFSDEKSAEFLNFHFEKSLKDFAVHSFYRNPEYVNEYLKFGKINTLDVKKIGSFQEKHDGVGWLNVVEGSIHMFASKDFALYANKKLWVPFTTNMWFQAETFTGCLLEKVTNALFHKNCLNGVNFFYDIIYETTAKKIKNTSLSKENLRLRTNELDDKRLDEAVYELEHILSDKKIFASTEEKNFFFLTCKLIGEKLNLTFKPFSTDTQYTRFQYLNILCQRSYIYFREIVFDGEWWSSDNGPFLGFNKQDLPVALFYDAGQYLLVNLQTDEKFLIGKNWKEFIEPRGIVFYRHFPEPTHITNKETFKFAIFGQKKFIKYYLLIGFFAAVLALFIPFATKVIYTVIIPNSDYLYLWQISAALLVISIATMCFHFFREFIYVKLLGNFTHDLQAAIMQRVLINPVSFFRKQETGVTFTKVMTVEYLQQEIFGAFMKTLINSFFALLFIIPMFYYSSTLTLYSLLFSAIVLFFSYLSYKKALNLYNRIYQSQEQLNSFCYQALTGITKIRIAGAEKRCFALWEKVFIEMQKLKKSLESLNVSVNVFVFAIATFLIFIIYAILIYGLKYTDSFNNFNVAEFVAFFAAFSPFILAIATIGLSALQLASGNALWRRSRTVLEENPETSTKKIPIPNLQGDILVSHLSFRYEKNLSNVLNNISLHAKPGEFIAIVGPSGSGKSTLIRILLGFEFPEKGNVFYDGKEITSLDLRQLRNKIGVVLQNSAIFDGTLRENVSSDGFYSDEEILSVLDLVGFTDDLKNLPMGLETYFMNGGMNFSGGQRQRVLLARALIRKPKIIILDEATSALDNTTQEHVYNTISKLQATRIVIAHRLSTIRDADRIYVMEKGKIRGSGTYEEIKNMKFFKDE